MVACGKTRDQIELTEQAHLLLNIGSRGPIVKRSTSPAVRVGKPEGRQPRRKDAS